MKRLGLILAAVLLVASPGTSQVLPILHGVTAIVTVQRSGDLYTYAYLIENSINSAGAVWTIAIDVSQPQDGQTLTRDGLLDGPEFLADTSQAILVHSQASRLVPVTANAPPGWLSSVNVKGELVWGAEESAALLAPGSRLIGFTVTSRGLPGIRRVVFDPYLDIAEVGIKPPSSESELKEHDAEIALLEARVRFEATTIGPTAPPATFNAARFLDAIEHYRIQAIQLGWIRGPGLGNSLNAKLLSARAAIERGQSRAATNVLNALLREVEAQSGKQLSPEAVALLRFNVEYLVSQLQ